VKLAPIAVAASCSLVAFAGQAQQAGDPDASVPAEDALVREEVPPAGTPEEQAFAAFERGRRAFEDDDYTGALSAFQEAMRLAPSDVVRFNMALCLERLARFRAALDEYRRASGSQELDAETRAEADERADRVEARLGTIVIPGPPGTRVRVVGVEECTAPCRVLVDPGRHEVRRADGGEGGPWTVNVDRGQEQPVAIETRVEEPPPPPFGGEDDGLKLRIGWIGWVGAGVAIASAIGTAFFGVRALALKDDYVANPTREDYDAGRASAFAANVFFVTTLIGVGAFAYDVFFVDHSSEQRRREGSTADRFTLRF
jgi:hypothetical protein